MISKKRIYISSKAVKKNNGDLTEGYNINALYDNGKGKVDVDLIKNGKMSHYEMNLKNMTSTSPKENEMKELQNAVLNYNMINIPLETRLINDFELSAKEPVMSLIPSMKKMKSKSKRSKRKKSKRKTKK